MQTTPLYRKNGQRTESAQITAGLPREKSNRRAADARCALARDLPACSAPSLAVPAQRVVPEAAKIANGEERSVALDKADEQATIARAGRGSCCSRGVQGPSGGRAGGYPIRYSSVVLQGGFAVWRALSLSFKFRRKLPNQIHMSVTSILKITFLIKSDCVMKQKKYTHSIPSIRIITVHYT